MATIPCTTSIIFYELAITGQKLIAMLDCKETVAVNTTLRVSEVNSQGKLTGRKYTAIVEAILGMFTYEGQPLTLLTIKNLIVG